MRVLVDIGEVQLKALDHMAKAEKVSRASLIRKAIGNFLDLRAETSAVDAFGLWGERSIDGLAHQDHMRGEW